jgi:hypothetical protein
MRVGTNPSEKESSLQAIRAVARPTNREGRATMATTSIPSTTDRHALHFAEARCSGEGEARDKFEKLLGYVRGEAMSRELHEVERGIFVRLLELGLLLLRLFLEAKGTGKLGEGKVATREGVQLRYHSMKLVTYFSIFGTLAIERAYYWDLGEEGVCPLDAVLNLPERRYSYLLQEWGDQIGVGRAFEQVTKQIETWLRVKLWSQAVQISMQDAAQDVDSFYEQKPRPEPASEAEFLVSQLDGKGVPIRREEPQGRKLRLGTGEKPNKKKEAIAYAVYSVDPFVRTPEDVVREVRDDATIVEPEDRPERPEPQNKHTRATLAGKDAAFAEVRRLLDSRDPKGTKTRLVLTDGSEALQERALRVLGALVAVVLILDIWHVLTYLWEASYAFHEEGSAEAARWVMHKLRLLCEGKVGYVIGDLRRKLGEGGFKKSRRKALTKAIRYMDRNRRFMRYDEYLARGYPIGSGVAEGACRHVVRDRMELAGMRWSVAGAQAVLDMRSVEINGDWSSFWEYRTRQESERLYAHLDIEDLAKRAKCAA